MAGFFEKFGAKVANVVGGASDAVGDFTQESKLKMQIKKCEDTIKGVKTKFGIEAVDAKLTGESADAILAKLDEACVKVEAVQKEIEALNAEILKMKEDKSKTEGGTDENKEA